MSRASVHWPPAATCIERERPKRSHSLIEAVDVIEDADLGRQIGLGAELFPKLASDRKESAAFYTQPATAELLAALTIRRSDKPDSEWARSDVLRRAIIADLACGTGALLRAGYSRVRTLHEWAGGTEDSVSELHRGGMEFGLRGTDISPIAAHLTLASLASNGKREQSRSCADWLPEGRRSVRTHRCARIPGRFGCRGSSRAGSRQVRWDREREIKLGSAPRQRGLDADESSVFQNTRGSECF